MNVPLCCERRWRSSPDVCLFPLCTLTYVKTKGQRRCGVRGMCGIKSLCFFVFFDYLFNVPLTLQTLLNKASTRSHCVFTVYLCARQPGSTTVRRSKLHLVDLAGSERVNEMALGGQLLTEAKYINLSLHYLEQVAGGSGGNRLDTHLYVVAVVYCVQEDVSFYMVV